MTFGAASNQLAPRSVIEEKLGPDLVAALDLLLNQGTPGQFARMGVAAQWETVSELDPLLNPGTNGQTLVVLEGVPTWVTLASDAVIGTTADPSAPNGTWVLIPEMTTTIVTHGLPVRVDFSSSIRSVATALAGDSCEVGLFVDGVEVPETKFEASVAAGLVFEMITTVAFAHPVAGLAAGSHTFEVKFRRPGANGTAKCRGVRRMLSVRETL